MKVLLISVESTLVCFGHRYVLRSLRDAGHRVLSLYSPREHHDQESPDELEAVAAFAAEHRPELLAFSLMSSHVPRMRAIRDAIRRRLDVPVLLGGVHPTLDPEESLRDAEYVCVGEGEMAVRELVQALEEGRDPAGIPNIWSRRNGEVVRSPVRDRHAPLEELGWPDHSFQYSYILRQGRVVPLDAEISRCHVPGIMDVQYVLSTRGCPHDCSYCCNSALRGVAGGPYVRRRSVQDFVAEMSELAALYPWLKGFVFMDDSFLAGPEAWFEEFARVYRERLGLPFLCWAAPQAVRPRVVELLAEAGCVGVHLGLQSGSPRILEEVYQRHAPPEEFLRAMQVLQGQKDRIRDIRIDVITDNPYETEEDTVRTILLVSRLPKPFFIGLVRLVWFPRTRLTERALADGKIQDSQEVQEVEFFHYAPTYLNRVLRTTRVTPGSWLRFFARGRHRPWVRGLFYLYYAYFVLVVLKAKAARRWFLRRILDRFGHRLPPSWVVITRVQLVDF